MLLLHFALQVTTEMVIILCSSFEAKSLGNGTLQLNFIKENSRGESLAFPPPRNLIWFPDLFWPN